MFKRLLHLIRRQRQPRVFLGFVEIAGYYKNLCMGFRQLGIHACFVSYWQHQFGYQDQKHVNFLVKFISYFIKELNTSTTSKFKRRVFYIGLLFGQSILFVWALWRFDVFIFGSATSFFTIMPRFLKKIFVFEELAILKKFGKKVIFVFHGSDSRPPYLDGNFCDDEPEVLIRMTKNQKDKTQHIEQYADYIISHQPSSQLHCRKTLKWLNIGIPYEAPMYDTLHQGHETVQHVKKITVLHCPSDLKVKGTGYIRQVVKILQNEGYDFDYVEISGKSNAEVIRAIQASDFVIDQLYSDTPMAGLATEAAWYGKPTIVTGYEIAKIISELDTDHIPPSLFGTPEQLKDLVIHLLEDVQFRNHLGMRAQNFVRTHWDSRKVAERFLKVIRGDIAESWFFNPTALTYSYGVGMSKETRKTTLQKLYSTAGARVFQVDDKPDLQGILLSEVQTEDILESSIS